MHPKLLAETMFSYSVSIKHSKRQFLPTRASASNIIIYTPINAEGFAGFDPEGSFGSLFSHNCSSQMFAHVLPTLKCQQDPVVYIAYNFIRNKHTKFRYGTFETILARVLIFNIINQYLNANAYATIIPKWP